MLKDWRLIEGKTIAIDSFKVRAQNSLKNNYNLAKIHRHLDYIDAKINAYCEELDLADDDEEKEQLHAKINDQIDKWNQYCELGDEIIQSGKEQLSTTDPDAQAVILHRNIVNVGYNLPDCVIRPCRSDGFRRASKQLVMVNTSFLQLLILATSMIPMPSNPWSFRFSKTWRSLSSMFLLIKDIIPPPS